MDVELRKEGWGETVTVTWGGGGWHQPRSPREDSDLGRKGPLSSVLQDKQPRLATAVPPACSVTP